MDDFDDPTESAHEKITETVKERKQEQRWSLWVAVSTAVIAALAAVASMLAGHHSNEALIEQIKASDLWAYYQAKSIKAELVASVAKPDSLRLAKLNNDQSLLQQQAREKEEAAAFHLHKHVGLARAVTLFQIAIAISAIAIVTSKRFLWFIALATATAGLVFFLSVV